jgi:uncharacterized membrane protein
MYPAAAKELQRMDDQVHTIGRPGNPGSGYSRMSTNESYRINSQENMAAHAAVTGKDNSFNYAGRSSAPREFKTALQGAQSMGGDTEARANQIVSELEKDKSRMSQLFVELQELVPQSVNAASEAASPSKKAIQAGKNIADGAIQGIRLGAEGAAAATATLQTNSMSWSEWNAVVKATSASLDVATADQILYEEIMKQVSTATRMVVPVAETVEEKLALMSIGIGEFAEIAQKASAQIQRGGSGIQLGTDMADKAFDRFTAKLEAQVIAEEELANMTNINAEAIQQFVTVFGELSPVMRGQLQPMLKAIGTGTSQAMGRVGRESTSPDPSMYQTVTRRGNELAAYSRNNAPSDEMDESPRTQAPKFTQVMPSSQASVVAAAEGTVATFAETVQTTAKVTMPAVGGLVIEDMVATVQAGLPSITAVTEQIATAISKPIIASAPNLTRASQRILAPFMNPQAEVTMQRLNEALIQNVKIVNENVLENSANNVALREGAQMLKIVNAPMNLFWGAVDKIGLAAENVVPMLTSASERIQIEFIKMQEQIEVLATTALETGAKIGVAVKQMAMAGANAVGNGAVATGKYLTTAQPNKISKSLRAKQANLRGDNGEEAQRGAQGGGGKGMMATMGLMMVTGMLSGIKGPIGDFANFLQPVLMGLSVMSMILPLLNAEQIAAMVGLGAAMMEFIVPIMAVIAVIALLILAFNFMADQAKKDAEKTAAANRKAADAIVGFGTALGVSKDQLQNFNDTFQTNLSGPGISESSLTSTGNGYKPVVQTNEQSQQTNKLVKDEGFLSANFNLLDQLKKAKGSQGDLLINSFAQTLKSEGAADADIKTYIEALKKAAGRQDLTLNFKTLDIGSKAGQAQLQQQITDSVEAYDKLTKTYSPEILARGTQLAQNAASVHGLTAKGFVSGIKKIGYGDDAAGQREEYRNSIIDQLKNNTDFQGYLKWNYGNNAKTNNAAPDNLEGQIKKFKKASSGQENNENSPFARMIAYVEGNSNANLAAFKGSKEGMSAGDLQILSTQAQLAATDVVNLGTAFKNGQISSKDFNKNMDAISASVQSLGAAKGKNYIDSLVDSMKGLKPETKAAIKGLSDMKDQLLLIKAASLGIDIDPNVVKTIQAGEAAQVQLNSNNPNMTGQGATILANQVAAGNTARAGVATSITNYMKALAAATEAAKTPLDKLNEKYQKQKDLLDAESNLLGKVQSKIEAAYKKRIDALNTIAKINETISQSQRDQLSLATALSQGDIAQAAAAAQTMRANNAKNALDQQSSALQSQSDAAVAAATITYKGKKFNQAQIDAAKEKADTANLLANNPGLGYSLGGMVGYATGGMVAPQYFARGGKPMGTDIVPAMLTPGEFVVKKSAVDRVGAHNLSALNGGMKMHSEHGADGSVYNYSVNVNVATGANPDQIANAVIKKVERLNSQNLRGNTYGA